ncbi:MAG TPA: galactose mutarotase [Planctomycetaceae bacterium]|nr:galactose mutarotase [Planctomycetaceae bacterium]
MFGRSRDGRPIELYTIENSRGLKAKVMTYGATLVCIEQPDRTGKLAPVTLYLDTFEEYLAGHPLFGSTVGRFANRISNAAFLIDGVRYELDRNAGQHHIHGGRGGFHKRIWSARPVYQSGTAGVSLSLVSPDGDQGYPGTLKVSVTYLLSEANELRIEYEATTDRPTHVNLTNHAYWNLAGAGSGDVLDHLLTIEADSYLVSDRRRMPTGRIGSVTGTPFDFRVPHRIGERIGQVPGGYDHCYVLKKPAGKRYALAATVYDPSSGRYMEVWTTQPGVQLYTANGLSDRFGASGKRYGRHHALCLETQHFPDSPNKPHFPTTLLRPGQRYQELTVHVFSVRR